jgi:predicted RNase H-like nuclease (RuvC/YqgF family)
MEAPHHMILRLIEEINDEKFVAPLNPEEEVISQAAEIDQLLAEIDEKDRIIEELQGRVDELEFIRRYDRDMWNWGDET